MGHGSISSLALSLSIQAWSHSTPSGKAEQLLGNDAVEWAYKIVAAARVQEVVNNKPITILQCEQEKKKKLWKPLHPSQGSFKVILSWPDIDDVRICCMVGMYVFSHGKQQASGITFVIASVCNRGSMV